MTLDSIVHYLHIVGAIGMFIGVAANWIVVNRVRTAATVDQTTEWLGLTAGVRVFGPASLGLTIVTGLYMAVVHDITSPWVGLAVAGIVLIAGLGAFSGIRLATLGKQISERAGQLSNDDRNRLNNPLLVSTVQIQLAILLAIVFLMTVKPDLGGSIVAMVSACIIGLASTLPVWQRSLNADKLVPGKGSRS
jgi:hypothetical protein